MSDNVNPSIVNDESGNNYGGIKLGSSLTDASMAYIENLSQLAKKAVPKAQLQETYFPGYRPDTQVGAVTGPTIGSFPLFATGGGLLPWGMYDVMQNAKAEAEANYLAGLKKEIDKPLYTQKLELADPFRQPAFAAKVQNTIDNYLDLYSKKYGGDMAKAYVSTKNDPNFQKTMRMYGEYVNMFQNVYDRVQEIEASEKPENFGKVYVPPEAKKAAEEFIYNHDNLEVLSPDQLYNGAKLFQTKMGAIGLAKTLTENIKDRIYETDYRKTESMSTDELDVYLISKQTNIGVADEIIKNAEEAYPYITTDLATKRLFENSVRSYIKNGVERSIQQIKKDGADRDLLLRKLGWLDEEGQIAQQRQPSALINAMGEWSLSYPPDVKPIPTTVGMVGYVVSRGKLHLVNIPGSYDFKPTAEYDIQRDGAGVLKGRYIEGKANFETAQSYTPDILKPGAIKGSVRDVGDGKSSMEYVPAKLEDVYTHEEVSVIGETSILIPYIDFRTKMEATIPHLKYVHDKIDQAKEIYPYGGKREPYSEYPNIENKPAVAGSKEPITLTGNEDIMNLNPNQLYKWGEKTMLGKDIMNRFNKMNTK